VSGDSQTVTAGSAAVPFVVKVVGQDGLPLANISVSWSVDSGGGSLSSATSTTDATGSASVTYTAGTKVSTATILSYVTDLPIFFVRFTVKQKAGVPSALLAFGGNGAATLPDKSLILVAKAADRNGNGVPGIRVTWSTGPGGQISAMGDTTDASGLARATFTVGAAPGRYTATATSASLGAATFAVDAISASTSGAAVKPDD
jgi:hypothetical protein